jgi:FKBP-type peptidyl-prolyl cis-trans isomerase (trigger factor)
MEVTDSDIDDELAEIAAATKSTPEETRKKWEEMGLMAVIREGVMHHKAVDWLMEKVTVIEVEPTEETEADAEAPADAESIEE